MTNLPDIVAESMKPTRDYLQDVAKVLGKLQQAFLPKSPRDWQYGLEVTMRGISTQAFKLNGEPTRVLLDLVRHKLRVGERNWYLREHPPAELFEEVQAWLTDQNIDVKLEEPEFNSGVMEYDTEQAEAYAVALWWMEEQFRALKSDFKTGVTSPVLLYPHHFDLSLVWFPNDDEQQLSLGWSTGDETVREPYVYMTAYPDAGMLKDIGLPAETHWQEEGFTGVVLPYASLRASDQPAELLKQLVSGGRSRLLSRDR